MKRPTTSPFCRSFPLELEFWWTLQKESSSKRAMALWVQIVWNDISINRRKDTKVTSPHSNYPRSWRPWDSSWWELDRPPHPHASGRCNLCATRTVLAIAGQIMCCEVARKLSLKKGPVTWITRGPFYQAKVKCLSRFATHTPLWIKIDKDPEASPVKSWTACGTAQKVKQYKFKLIKSYQVQTTVRQLHFFAATYSLIVGIHQKEPKRSKKDPKRHTVVHHSTS